ncbi:hypothetical protein R6Q59_036249 [Mikania micrantha]
MSTVFRRICGRVRPVRGDGRMSEWGDVDVCAYLSSEWGSLPVVFVLVFCARKVPRSFFANSSFRVPACCSFQTCLLMPWRVAKVALFRQFYRFCVDGEWFTFEKRRAPTFPPCMGKVLHYLRDWKTWFFFVSDRFLPRPLPCRDIKRVIEDSPPPPLDCDRRLHKLLVCNASPALGFPEPYLKCCNCSPEHSLLEDVSSTDDPLSKLLKGKAVVAAESSKAPNQRVPLRFRLRSHAQAQHLSETSTTDFPMMPLKRKASLVAIVEECVDKVSGGESSREKRR